MFLLTVFHVFVSLSLMYQGSIYAYDDGLQHIVPVQHMEQQVVTVTSFGGLIYASQVTTRYVSKDNCNRLE